MATVDIILSTYNRVHYLKEAVESVCLQTFQDWELIIVNDGSTDETRALIDQYSQADPRIRAIHQPNAGLARARNNGIRAARSKYLAFLDDDDVWLNEKLEKQIAHFETHPKLGFLYSRAHVTDNQLRHLRVVPEEMYSSIEKLIEWTDWLPLSSVMVRRDCLNSAGLFDESLDRGTDYDLWLRIVRRFPFDGLDQSLLLYRQHKDNMSASAVKRLENHLVIFRKAIQYPEFKPFIGLIRRRKAHDLYALGRLHRQQQEYLRAAGYFFRSVLTYPFVGSFFYRYRQNKPFVFSLLKPYFAIGYCFLKTWVPASRGETKKAAT